MEIGDGSLTAQVGRGSIGIGPLLLDMYQLLA